MGVGDRPGELGFEDPVEQLDHPLFVDELMTSADDEAVQVAAALSTLPFSIHDQLANLFPRRRDHETAANLRVRRHPGLRHLGRFCRRCDAA